MQINPFNANFEQLADVAQSHKTSKSLVRQLVKFLIIIIQFPKEGYLQYSRVNFLGTAMATEKCRLSLKSVSLKS